MAFTLTNLGEALESSGIPMIDYEEWGKCFTRKEEVRDPFAAFRIEAIRNMNIRPMLAELLKKLGEDPFLEHCVNHMHGSLEIARADSQSVRLDPIARNPIIFLEGWVANSLGSETYDCPYTERTVRYSDVFEHGVEKRKFDSLL